MMRASTELERIISVIAQSLKYKAGEFELLCMSRKSQAFAFPTETANASCICGLSKGSNHGTSTALSALALSAFAHGRVP